MPPDPAAEYALELFMTPELPAAAERQPALWYPVLLHGLESRPARARAIDAFAASAARWKSTRLPRLLRERLRDDTALAERLLRAWAAASPGEARPHLIAHLNVLLAGGPSDRALAQAWLSEEFPLRTLSSLEHARLWIPLAREDESLLPGLTDALVRALRAASLPLRETVRERALIAAYLISRSDWKAIWREWDLVGDRVAGEPAWLEQQLRWSLSDPETARGLLSGLGDRPVARYASALLDLTEPDASAVAPASPASVARLALHAEARTLVSIRSFAREFAGLRFAPGAGFEDQVSRAVLRARAQAEAFHRRRWGTPELRRAGAIAVRQALGELSRAITEFPSGEPATREQLRALDEAVRSWMPSEEAMAGGTTT